MRGWIGVVSDSLELRERMLDGEAGNEVEHGSAEVGAGWSKSNGEASIDRGPVEVTSEVWTDMGLEASELSALSELAG